MTTTKEETDWVETDRLIKKHFPDTYERMELNVKKDREEVNKIIENCLPLMKMSKKMCQDCADAIILYFIEGDKEMMKYINKTRNCLEGFERTLKLYYIM